MHTHISSRNLKFRCGIFSESLPDIKQVFNVDPLSNMSQVTSIMLFMWNSSQTQTFIKK